MRHASKLLAVLLAIVLLPATPAFASSYDQVISITFPMPGYDYIAEGGTYDACRSGCSRVHRATDIMGDYGVPVYAAMGGRITWITGEDGNPPSYGYMLSIAGDDGREYSYVHLGRQDKGPSSAYAPGIRDGARVERGQLIGYNGDSGNTRGNPHLHFEIEDPNVTDPYGSNRMDPYNSLMDALKRGDLPGSVKVGRIPVAGDWNGDGVATPGYFENGTWTLYDSFEAAEPYLTLQYGTSGDLPVVGDWDADGTDTIGVVRPYDGRLRWLLRNKYVSGNKALDMYYGVVGDIPVAGDWDGDGDDTIGVVRDGNRWILRNRYVSGNKALDMYYGEPGDKPVTGDWDGDGDTTIGIVRGDLWVLRNVYKRSAQDVVFRMNAGAHVLAASFDGKRVEVPAVVRGTEWTIRHSFSSSSASTHKVD